MLDYSKPIHTVSGNVKCNLIKVLDTRLTRFKYMISYYTATSDEAVMLCDMFGRTENDIRFIENYEPEEYRVVEHSCFFEIVGFGEDTHVCVSF